MPSAVSTFFIAIGLSLVGGFGGLLVASGVLLIKDSARSKLVPWLVSYAVGALLGVSMLALLPTTLEQLPPARVFHDAPVRHPALLRPRKAGAWRHCHTHDCEVHESSVVAGPGRRRVPQLRRRRGHRRRGHDVGAARRQHGVRRGSARNPAGGGRLRHPAACRLLARPRADAERPLGGGQRRRARIAAFLAFDIVPRMLPYFLALAAASFLYVAMADLIPGPPPRADRRRVVAADPADRRRRRERCSCSDVHRRGHVRRIAPLLQTISRAY